MFKIVVLVVACVIGVWCGEASAQEPMTMDICPNDYNNFPMDGPPLICGCSAEQAKADETVWGANPYYAGSSICHAALQAGAIPEAGGQILVTPAPNVAVFPSVTRNGVRSSSSARGDGFKVAAASGQPAPAAQPAQAQPAEPASSDQAAINVCPNDFVNFPMDGPPLSCSCSAEKARADESVWGPNPYYYGSSICRAAVHAGAITSKGGTITVTPTKAVPVYPSITRNNVRSASSGPSDGFTVSSPSGAPVSVMKADADAITLDICPNDFVNFPTDSPPLKCPCPAEKARADETLWGANPYYFGSAICRAAVQAGAITTAGGDVVVTSVTDVMVFPSVTRNNVRSASSTGGNGFTVASATGPADLPMVKATPTEIVLDICPNDYVNFPEDSPPMTCQCSAEKVRADETIWGANPYYFGSAICRAALHAGAVDKAGGEIRVTAVSGVPVFPSVTRNGVKSTSSGPDHGFKVEGTKPLPVAAPAAVDAAGKPVQAPIAESLKETGRVQLYINFATGKADPLPSSAPVLGELLAVLKDQPDLKLELVGHTDNQGGASYNLDLSQRRAASIYYFLVKSGIPAERLRSTGLGFLQPIADNATDEGRALNRRVEAKQTQ